MEAIAKAHFGANVPQIKRTWEEASSAALEFESLGFDSIWVNDHLYGPQSPQIPILEAWTSVAALAAVTDRVEIGTLVTPAGMRNPAHLGKMIATADEIAGGRIIPGLGGGWMEREFTDFGMPFLSTRERLRQLEETVVLLKRMWTEAEPVTFEGEHVRVENLVCEPKPPRTPPILIGGAGERVTCASPPNTPTSTTTSRGTTRTSRARSACCGSTAPTSVATRPRSRSASSVS